ncbi:uncharacterized protein [Bemisia tabaci]|uniref:uncharacterized protein n=1 Tax=Bemisia tabaci TaxID=7038 RepID=UPI0008F9E225|nr:PREDICTED: uncharacterized protein LOC109043475 [Bemisia tabaci]
MTEELTSDKTVNLDDAQPIDLSKSSRALFQERIRRENHRPVPQLIPLSLLPSLSLQRQPRGAHKDPERPGLARSEHPSKGEMSVHSARSKSRLARVKSCPYLYQKRMRRLSASQKSKSDSRISLTSSISSPPSVLSVSSSTQATTCAVSTSSDRLSRLFISADSRPSDQGLGMEDEERLGRLSSSESYRYAHESALRPISGGENARRVAGVSPSTINSLRSFLQRKQQNHASDPSSSDFNNS